MPKVSVLMPVYRTNEHYLREAVESVLAQSFADFEFLILDDCPSESRESVIRSYKDERIFYYKNEKNLGISASRNKLLSLAKGEYLAVVDHDDINMKERFEKQVAFLDANEEVGVVGANATCIVSKKKREFSQKDKDIKVALMKHCEILHPASMIRKSVLEKNQICYEEEFSPAEDYMLWCRLIDFTKFANLSDTLLCYRDHEQSTSETQFEKMREVTQLVYAFVRTKHPELYWCYKNKALVKTQIRIFGFLPFLTVKEQGNKRKIYLFGRILLLSVKRVEY